MIRLRTLAGATASRGHGASRDMQVVGGPQVDPWRGFPWDGRVRADLARGCGPETMPA
jgi:hypothetical protein